MATKTMNLSAADEGRVLWQADYDDVTNRVTALRVINGSDQGPNPANCASRLSLVNDPTVMFPADGSFLITAPGQTNNANLNPQQSQRWQLVVTTNPTTGQPRLANLEGEFQFPAP